MKTNCLDFTHSKYKPDNLTIRIAGLLHTQWINLNKHTQWIPWQPGILTYPKLNTACIYRIVYCIAMPVTAMFKLTALQFCSPARSCSQHCFITLVHVHGFVHTHGWFTSWLIHVHSFTSTVSVTFKVRSRPLSRSHSRFVHATVHIHGSFTSTVSFTVALTVLDHVGVYAHQLVHCIN